MVELPDVSDLSIKKEKINWEQIHGRFLLMPVAEFGKGTYAKLAKQLGVPQTSFERHSKFINPNTGKNWWQERKEHHQQVSTDVQKHLIQTQTEQRIELIDRDTKRLDTMSKKLNDYIESEAFEVNEENLKYMLDAYEKIKMNYAKLLDIIRDSGGSKAYRFNINIPLKYVTAEGRAWLAKIMENPVSNILEGDFEDITDEEQMKHKNLAEGK